jgi:hypothetical protein
MAPEVLDQAVREDEIEVLAGEQDIGLTRVALDRCHVIGYGRRREQVYHRYVCRANQSPFPPTRSAAQIKYLELSEVGEALRNQFPTMAP